MFLIEIRVPRHALDDDDRRTLAAEITDGIAGGHGAATVPEATMRRARRMMHIGFAPLDGWHTGDGPWEGAPPLWVTLTVPDAWRPEVSATMTGMVRRAVAHLDARHGWHRPGGDLWINTVGIADGSLGLDGTASTADEVVSYMTEEFRSAVPDGAELPDGVVIDPMCGMQVRLGPRAITLEHDGTTLGFCAHACRSAYAHQEGIPLPA